MNPNQSRIISCIFCGLNKESSDEHVIPDSIGGVYHIYNVCKDCNGFLGEHVDCKLTNHKFMEFERLLRGIKGKSGKIPNPFGKNGILKSGECVRIELDSDGKPKPYFIPKIGEIQGDFQADGKAIIHVTGDARDESAIRKAIEKKLIRAGLPTHSLQENITRSEIKPEIEAKLSIDLRDFKVSLIKIAYEFTCDQISSYESSSDARYFREFLMKTEVDDNFINDRTLGNGFNHEQTSIIESIVEFNDSCHYVLLSQTDIGLTCMVQIFDKFSILVKMSSELNFDGVRLLINNTQHNKCRVFNEAEIASKTVEHGAMRFGYYFETKEKADEFLNLERNSEFNWETVPEGNVAFFDETLSSVIGDVNSLFEEGKFIADYGESFLRLIPKMKLFVKILPSGNYIRVLELMEPIQSRKLPSIW